MTLNSPFIVGLTVHATQLFVFAVIAGIVYSDYRAPFAVVVIPLLQPAAIAVLALRCSSSVRESLAFGASALVTLELARWGTRCVRVGVDYAIQDELTYGIFTMTLLVHLIAFTVVFAYISRQRQN